MRRASKLLHKRPAQRADLNDVTHVEREFLRPVCSRKIGCNGVCAAAALDLIDHRVGPARGAAIVDQHLSARFPEG